MMDKNQKMIILELMNHETVSGSNLSSVIKMSTRSVRTIIKNINEDICGAKIESGSFGYRLTIETPETFLAYLQRDQNGKEESRLAYLFNRFIDCNNYLKIDDLCDELYLSRTQLKQSLKELREYLHDFDLTIATKAYYGMYLEGDEINKRRAIAHFEEYQMDFDILQRIRDIVISSIANADYVISDDVLDNLVAHLYIAYYRVMKKEYANIDSEWLEEIKEEKEYSLGCAIMELMNKIMAMEYRIEEVAYLTMHLCGKNSKQLSNNYINQEILDIVKEMLMIIEKVANIPFQADLNLQLALSLHLIPLVKRIQYGTFMHNPLKDEIKSKLIMAYELAVKACVVINQRFNCTLSEDEIAYFALHINLSLEQKKYNFHRNNILVVCSSGVGSARLLEYFFKENFNDYIEHLEVCSLHELENISLTKFDCIFTTVPLAIKVNTVVNKLNKDENLGQWILDDKQVRISRWKIMRMKVFDNGKFSNINLQVSTNDYNRFVRWNSGIESVPQVTNNGNSLVIQSTADCSIIVEPELRKSYLIVDSTGHLLDNSHGGNYLQVCDLKSSPLRKGIDALEASLAFDYQRYASRYSSPEVRIYAKQA